MSGQLFAPNLTKTPSTSIDFAPGSEHVTTLGAVYKYVKAAEAIAQYQFVGISTDGNFTITEADTDDANLNGVLVVPAGCAQVAFANGTYGWLFSWNYCLCK